MDELAVYYKGYLETLRKSQHTIKQYVLDTKQFLNFMQEHNLTFEGTLSKVVNSYNDYLEDVYSSVASINRKRASLLHFLTFLQQRNIVTSIPESLLKPRRSESKPIPTLTIAQLKMVTNYWLEVYQSAMDNEHRWMALRNFCLVNMLLELGLKPSEIIGMKWTSIGDKDMTIVQNKKRRKLLLSETLLKWLELYQRETGELFPFSKEGGFVWLGLGNKENAPITVKTVERIFQTMSRKLGFKITATNIRYTLIHTEVRKYQQEHLNALYIRFGYSRKSVLLDRIKRFNLNV